MDTVGNWGLPGFFCTCQHKELKREKIRTWGVPSMKWVKPWRTSRTKSQAYRSSILTQALESLEAQQQRDCGSGKTFVSECKMDFNIFSLSFLHGFGVQWWFLVQCQAGGSWKAGCPLQGNSAATWLEQLLTLKGGKPAQRLPWTGKGM